MKINLVLCLLVLSIQTTTAQFGNQQVEEYSIINEIYHSLPNGSDKNKINIFGITTEVKFWPSAMKYIVHADPPIVCNELSEFLDNNFILIEKKIIDLKTVELDRSRLGKRINLVQDYKDGIKKISFPLIIENFAFLLEFDNQDQIVYVLKRDSNNDWKLLCIVFLYQGPMVDYIPTDR
jgi:hypothetical protein